MNLCLVLLASLASPIFTSHSPAVDPDSSLPPSPLNVAYRCASSQLPVVGRRIPTVLDCLNVLTFVLATTPNHNQPTRWSQAPGSGRTLLPYRRSSGTCQLVVRLTTTIPSQSVETASFDQVIAAALRVIEVCLLSGRADVDPLGGVALAGMGHHLDIVVWGAPDTSADEAVLGNGTNVLNGSDALVYQISQS